jgi:lincosamide nucleotidyltransferase A/C/D/E
MSEMTGPDAVALLDALSTHGIEVWIDGGWAVDACLGRQTRRHADLDIVIEERDVDGAVALLRDAGYGPAWRGDTRAWNFALGDAEGHEVDFHVIVIDADGRGQYGPAGVEDFAWEAEALSHLGSIDGRVVRCMPPEWLVRFHSGYELDADDVADVLALCARFSIAVPDEILAAQMRLGLDR